MPKACSAQMFAEHALFARLTSRSSAHRLDLGYSGLYIVAQNNSIRPPYLNFSHKSRTGKAGGPRRYAYIGFRCPVRSPISNSITPFVVSCLSRAIPRPSDHISHASRFNKPCKPRKFPQNRCTPRPGHSEQLHLPHQPWSSSRVDRRFPTLFPAARA